MTLLLAPPAGWRLALLAPRACCLAFRCVTASLCVCVCVCVCVFVCARAHLAAGAVRRVSMGQRLG